MEDGQQSLLLCVTQASLNPWQQAVGSKILSIPKPGPGSGPWCLRTRAAVLR